MKKSPIVILHGWGLSGEKYQELSRLLSAKGYKVFAPDLPGFGHEKPPSYAFHLADYVQFVHRYLKSHNIIHPIFIGHSFGGRISLKFASIYPGIVRAYILTGTPGYTPVPRRKLALFISVAKIGKWFFRLPVLQGAQDFVRKWYYYAVGAREFYRADGVMRQVFKNIVEERLDGFMKNVQEPCILVWGELDRITPVWIAERMQKEIKGSTLIVIPESDHGVSYKQSTRFVDSIIPFISRL